MNYEPLTAWIQANIPIMAVNILGPEELSTISAIAQTFSTEPIGLPVKVWHLGCGLRNVYIDQTVEYGPNDLNTASPYDVLRAIGKAEVFGVYILVDFHKFLYPPREDLALTAHLKLLADTLKFSRVRSYIILLGENITLPPDLHRKIRHYESPLPNRERVRQVLESTLSALEKSAVRRGQPWENRLDADTMTALVRAAQGLTESEICDEMRVVAIRGQGKIDEAAVRHFGDYKISIFRRFGVEFFDHPTVGVGGAENLKLWCRRRGALFAGSAPSHLPAPRGIMLVGPTGTGKTHIAKSVAYWWGVRALSINVGSLLGSLVGESEHRLRDLLRLAEATAPVVLVIDEVEKAFAGLKGDASGVTSRMFGYLLTWMAEHTQPVFVICTANDITNLPPEFLRKGRFDEVFFVDLPGLYARSEIFAVHLERRGLVVDEELIDTAAAETDGYSGAEIEEIVNLLALAQWEQGRLHEPVTLRDLQQAISEVYPQSQREPDAVNSLRRACLGTRQA